jgi:hypothetical protein
MEWSLLLFGFYPNWTLKKRRGTHEKNRDASDGVIACGFPGVDKCSNGITADDSEITNTINSEEKSLGDG